VPRIPEDAVFTPREALTVGQDLIDRGRAFHAHEVFEAMWKQADEQDRVLWRALAQLAVAITHLQRGNHKGALALLRRATEAIDPLGARYDVDSAGLVEYADALMADIQAGADIGADRLRPRVLIRHP
jgi:predicted metal-dependent hydrolase